MDQGHSGRSRREFFSKVGAMSAGAFNIVRPESVRGSQANSKVTFALIGCGGRGTFDASIVAKDERAQFTVLCDKFEDRTDNAKAQLGASGAAVYKDYEKALASDVDAVIIATPPFLHPPMLEAAVQAKKHVYCEKPMGVDYDGCKRVIKAGRSADPKKNVSVGFQQRYGPVYLEAYKRMKDGEIGELVNARAFWIGQDPFQRKAYADAKTEKLRNWFCYKDYSGDFIVEQDCHNFDVLHWFVGLPTRAVGYGGRKVRTSMDLLDHLSLTFEFPNGIHVNFEANQMSPPGFGRVGEEFTGTKGVLLTSRGSMTHIKGAGPDDRETMKSEGDITVDAFKAFITRIKDGEVENVAERSAQSTMIAILGRTALYTNKEVTWKGLYGA
jgi:myo-inositol 2-dehydrogenase / D-chiro-inositol 1-dehydrogenase